MRARGGSLILIVHGWRGVGRDRDLFNVELRLGFVTVAVCRFCVNDRLRRIADRLHQISETLR